MLVADERLAGPLAIDADAHLPLLVNDLFAADICAQDLPVTGEFRRPREALQITFGAREPQVGRPADAKRGAAVRVLRSPVPAQGERHIRYQIPARRHRRRSFAHARRKWIAFLIQEEFRKNKCVGRKTVDPIGLVVETQ